MKRTETGIFYAAFLIVLLMFHFGCAPSKKQSQEPAVKMAITPSSFRCTGNVIESKPESLTFAVKKITERGSSLFYSVSAGDTIEAIFLQSSPVTNISSGKEVELLIEERLKLNSEKPEFVVKQIQ